MGIYDMYDYKATRDNVFDTIETYKVLRLSLENSTPYFTKELMLAYTNCSGVSDPTASYGDWVIETKEKFIEQVAKVMVAFNKLYDEDRRLIKALLLDDQRLKTNDSIMYELGYSRDPYLAAKKGAIIRFGVALGVEVEKDNQKTMSLKKCA